MEYVFIILLHGVEYIEYTLLHWNGVERNAGVGVYPYTRHKTASYNLSLKARSCASFLFHPDISDWISFGNKIDSEISR